MVEVIENDQHLLAAQVADDLFFRRRAALKLDFQAIDQGADKGIQGNGRCLFTIAGRCQGDVDNAIGEMRHLRLRCFNTQACFPHAPCAENGQQATGGLG
jgi:hypothetical protein